jgi:pathogenesis-related protein 1
MLYIFCFVIAFAGAGRAQEARSGPWHSLDTASSQGVSAQGREMVSLHNRVRARMGVPPLAWSDKLAAQAREWADTLLARNQFFHRPNSAFGENLFEITGASASAAQVVDAWAGEIRDYDYASNRCRSVCGHYTQIVWRDTREVGCATARGGRREVWVCNYDPPGNWVGKRPY